MMEPQRIVVTRKRAGRPSISQDGESVPVTVTLPVKKFDELCRRAQREGVSVPEIIRRALDASNGKEAATS